MGKYTNLARKTEKTKPQESGVGKGLDNTYKHTIAVDTSSNSVLPSSEDATPLRGYAVNAVIRCIHGTTVDKCAVCCGYVRWLAEDEGRLLAAQANPEAVRREFWQLVRCGE